MTLYTINQKFLAAPLARPDAAADDRRLRVAEMFGLGLDETRQVILYDRLRVDVRPGDVVFVTGPSGSGKSVLVRRLAEAMREADPAVHLVNLADTVAAADRPVIDLLHGPLDACLRLLSAAGLADAFLLLRTADELSDGQRYRLRLALALENCGLRI